MSTKRSSFRPEFKFKVAMEVASGQATLNEIASKYKIHPNQISRWKKHLLDEGASLFTDGRSKRTKETDSAEKIDQLYQEVGRLQVSLNWYKKNTELSIEQKRKWVDPTDPEFSVATQCEMLGLPRSSYYYRPSELDPATIETMKAIDEEYTRHPFYGKRTMARYLGEQGYKIGVKRTRTLMSIMGLVSVAPGPNTSCPHPEHKKYPYLLRNLAITRPNQVWAIDITYIRLSYGHVYLTAIIDWFSRYIISWRLSPTLDSEFCVRCAEEAFERSGCPEIFNSDQGVQFTSREFIKELEKRSVTISMDSKGRAFDNIMIERLWRTIKYEEVYLKEYTGIADCRSSLDQYIKFYNTSRYHSAIGGTPYDVYSRKF